VVDTVYQEFRGFNAKSIDRYCVVDNTITSVDESHETFRELIDMIWKKFKGCSGIELSGITHQDGSAWNKANSSHNPFLDDKNIKIDGEGLLNEG
jgi:uncharacterized phage-associated protein